MDWILGIQLPKNNRVKYLTSDMESPSTMEYFKFLDFIQQNCHVPNFFAMKHELDSFQTVLVLKDGTWEVQPEIVEPAQVSSFTQLYEFTEKKKEEEQKKERYAADPLAHIEDLLKNKKLPGITGKLKSSFFKPKPMESIGKFWRSK